MEDAIAAGRVLVNGKPAQVGQQIDVGSDRIEYDGRLLRHPAPGLEYILLNKPRGVITTAADERGRETVVDLVAAGTRVFPVGRLDRYSEGLVLLSNDGELANRLTHPRFGHRRRYLVTVEGRLAGGDLLRLRTGIVIGDRRTRPAEVRVRSQTGNRTVLEIALREGRNRQIRRMLAACGRRVKRLVRTEFAGLRIDSLRPGQQRRLTPSEVDELRRVAGVSVRGAGD
jgi:pseudouridine synthase